MIEIKENTPIGKILSLEDPDLRKLEGAFKAIEMRPLPIPDVRRFILINERNEFYMIFIKSSRKVSKRITGAAIRQESHGISIEFSFNKSGKTSVKIPHGYAAATSIFKFSKEDLDWREKDRKYDFGLELSLETAEILFSNLLGYVLVKKTPNASS